MYYTRDYGKFQCVKPKFFDDNRNFFVFYFTFFRFCHTISYPSASASSTASP